MRCVIFIFFFFQAEDGIRDLVRSRGLGDVYKRQDDDASGCVAVIELARALAGGPKPKRTVYFAFYGLSLIHI